MQVLGFNFTKISGERLTKITKAPVTNIEFTDFEKNSVDLLKEGDAAKISFKYDINYSEDKSEKENQKEGQIGLAGDILLSVTKEELKEMTKTWKKQQLPESVKVPLFNLILRKCTPKAVHLQDELTLPFHVPMPRVSGKRKE